MDRIITLVFILISIGLSAQEPMRVTRSAAVDRDAPIYNIFIDADNKKWVGNSKGTFQVHTVDYASKIEKEAGQTSLFRYQGGNFNVTWNTSAVFELMKAKTDGLFEGEQDITGAFYDPNKKELWIGTKGIGVFRFDLKKEPSLLEHMTMDNSKLRTDQITVMFSDKPGSYWIGTEEGVLHNNGSKWKLYERYVSIEAIDISGTDIWVYGEEFLWKVVNGKDWEEIELDVSLSVGKIKDITFDSRGRMWIASKIIARYNPELETVETFGDAEYFTSDFPSTVAVDQEDAIWVGTEDKGLYLIEKATAMSISCIMEKAPGCDGQSNAELKVVVSGGSEPYTYQWNGGLSGELPKNVKSGDYIVTVTDSKGKSKTAEISVNDPAIALSVSPKQAESAPNANDGVASVEVSGGQGEYTYQWDNGESTMQAKKLSQGEHSVTVVDKAGCSSVATVSITQQSAALVVALEQTSEVACTGQATAALSVTINGGKGPFQYAWNAASLSGENPQNLASGDYEVTITDSEGSVSAAKISIKEPEAVTAKISVEAPASTGNADGKASVKAKGGTGDYTYKWDTGENTATASKLGPGERSVTVTDGAGCTITTSVAIDENILPLNAALDQTNEITCNGATTAALTVTANGGKAPYQYAWSTATLKGENPKDIAAGDYEVTITDEEGTTALAKISIKEPKALTAEIRIEAPASTGNADGKASVKAKGGTGDYTYKWDTGEAKATASKLAPGERSVSVTDEAGCTITASVAIDENILPLNAALDQASEITCNGAATAALNVSVNGGKGPYQYAWNVASLQGENPKDIAAGDYEVTITDEEGTTALAKISIKEPKALTAEIRIEAPASTGNADGKASVKAKGGTGDYTYKWDTGEAKATASKLAPGERSVSVTDEAGCTITASVTIDENILPLNAALDQVSEITCNGAASAALTVSVNGGKGPYQYAWNAAALKGENPKNITAGNYELTITDEEGTTASAKISVKEPEALVAKITVEAPASTGNADGKATVKISGGTGAFSYKWDTGEATATASKLAPGERSVTVTDEAGCTVTANIAIDENILPLAVSLEQSGEIACHGETTAALTVQVNGGKGPYQYAWNAASLNGENPKNLAPGTYEVTITDGEGTTASANFSVKEPEVLAAQIVENRRTSNENSKDGKATVAITGGRSPFTISWDNGEKGKEAEALDIGNHTATVVDKNGCKVAVDFETKKKILPSLTLAKIRKGQTIKMEQLLFEADSTRITPVSFPVLDELYDFIIENTSVVIEVRGHTNNIPPPAFCDRLSSARAKSVADYVVQKGIDPKRVFSKGYGKRKPITSNRTKEGRKKNQRVEVKILSL
ncbi:MAG: OmpA family protein [Saprospiraceae bacterium]